jgi:hypothetical protein
MSGGKSFDLRAENRLYKALNNGLITSLANSNILDQFFMSDRHTSGASATFKRYYLIAKFGTDLYVKFTDASSTQQKYCKGIVENFSRTWSDSENLLWNCKINWASVW